MPAQPLNPIFLLPLRKISPAVINNPVPTFGPGAWSYNGGIFGTPGTTPGLPANPNKNAQYGGFVFNPGLHSWQYTGAPASHPATKPPAPVAAPAAPVVSTPAAPAVSDPGTAYSAAPIVAPDPLAGQAYSTVYYSGPSFWSQYSSYFYWAVILYLAYRYRHQLMHLLRSAQ